MCKFKYVRRFHNVVKEKAATTETKGKHTKLFSWTITLKTIEHIISKRFSVANDITSIQSVFMAAYDSVTE